MSLKRQEGVVHKELGIYPSGNGEPLRSFKEVRNRTGYVFHFFFFFVFYFNRSLVVVQKTELLKDGDKNKEII